jgi:hypothetical protein
MYEHDASCSQEKLGNNMVRAQYLQHNYNQKIIIYYKIYMTGDGSLTHLSNPNNRYWLSS